MSEILVLKEIMHRLMVEENKECKRDGRVLLNRPRKPCEYFDLIGVQVPPDGASRRIISANV